jgi:hypothetical protein
MTNVDILLINHFGLGTRIDVVEYFLLSVGLEVRVVDPSNPCQLIGVDGAKSSILMEVHLGK